MGILENLKKGVTNVVKKSVRESVESSQELSDLEDFIEKADSKEEKFRAEILSNISAKMEEGRAEGDLENHRFIIYLSEKDYSERGESRRQKLKKSLEEKCNSHARKLVMGYSNEPQKIEINIGYDENLNFNTENLSKSNDKSRFSDLFRVEVANDSQLIFDTEEIAPIIKQKVSTFTSQSPKSYLQTEVVEFQKEENDNNEEIETVFKDDNDRTELIDDDGTVFIDENESKSQSINSLYYLEVFNGEELIQNYDIKKGSIIIGRQAKNTNLTKADVILENKEVSREHAELVIDRNNFWLIHKGSVTPTLLENRTCALLVKTSIEINQKIQIASFTIIIRKK